MPRLDGLFPLPASSCRTRWQSVNPTGRESPGGGRKRMGYFNNLRRDHAQRCGPLRPQLELKVQFDPAAT